MTGCIYLLDYLNVGGHGLTYIVELHTSFPRFWEIMCIYKEFPGIFLLLWTLGQEDIATTCINYTLFSKCGYEDDV